MMVRLAATAAACLTAFLFPWPVAAICLGLIAVAVFCVERRDR